MSESTGSSRDSLRSIEAYRRERGLSPLRVHLRKPFSVLAQHWFGWKWRTRFWALAGVRIQTSYVGRECFFDQEVPELITIEDGVTISTRVSILSHDTHRGIIGPVTVRQGAFIGAGAILLPGIEIGRGATVGAGAVVARSVAPGTTVIGNPARVLNKSPDHGA